MLFSSSIYLGLATVVKSSDTSRTMHALCSTISGHYREWRLLQSSYTYHIYITNGEQENPTMHAQFTNALRFRIQTILNSANAGNRKCGLNGPGRSAPWDPPDHILNTTVDMTAGVSKYIHRCSLL